MKEVKKPKIIVRIEPGEPTQQQKSTWRRLWDILLSPRPPKVEDNECGKGKNHAVNQS